MESTALCKLCAGLDIQATVERIVSQENDDQDSDSLSLESPWHSTLASVDASSSSCALCTIIMKGWQASRDVVVEQAIQNAMFDTEDPPTGLNDPVNRIPAYRDAEGVALEVVRRTRRVRDGRGNGFSLFLWVECGPTVMASFDVLDRVVTELRIAQAGGDSVAVDAVHAVSADIALHTDLLVQEDPLSQDSLAIARAWLETCVSCHGADCSPSVGAEGWMPTRLLEVVPGARIIYLRESATLSLADDARYVALSHCWGQGGTPFTTTTHETLHLRTGGIDIDDLPQTFRDSVTLTKELGLRYLWIDSLCIIQDDADDWAREAMQMAHVYRNAHLVLNAANSDSDSKGFLQPRHIQDAISLPPPSSSPSPTSRASSNLNLTLQLLPPSTRHWTNSTGGDTLTNEPISFRAWCLQEHILPARALQYGSHQMFWACERVRASENGDAVAQRRAARDGNDERGRRGGVDDSSEGEGKGEGKGECKDESEGTGGGGQLARLCVSGNIGVSVFARGAAEQDPARESVAVVNWVGWHRMLEDYSARRITRHTDRLPALAGLALAVGRETGGSSNGEDYLAGLWRTGLLEGLMWCRALAEQKLAATPEYVAPSWSWAAVVGPVQFSLYRWYTRRAHWKARMADYEALAEYCGHKMLRRDRDPYGRLDGGSLTLRAPLLRVASVRPRQAQPPGLHSLFGHAPGRSEVADVVVQMRLGSVSEWVEGGFDDGHAEIDTAKLVVIFLSRLPYVLEEGFVEQRFGLILEPVDGSKKYRRVGFIDGVVLKKSVLGALKGHGMFTVLRYPRPFKKDDIYDSVRDNDLAEDPLKLEKTEVTIC
jgi:cytochrome c553